MKNIQNKISCFAFVTVALLTIGFKVTAQYKSFQISIKGDTINAVDKKNLKQGKWVVTVAELRGEPGYEEEGVYYNDRREGIWRKFTLQGDQFAVETVQNATA